MVDSSWLKWLHKAPKKPPKKAVARPKSTKAQLADVLEKCAKTEAPAVSQKEKAYALEEDLTDIIYPEDAPKKHPAPKTADAIYGGWKTTTKKHYQDTHATTKPTEPKPQPSLKEEPAMTKETDKALESNVSALKHLREQPRGTNVDARIAAIQNLLGEKEVYHTLHNLRWPKGAICPRCHSTNVVRRSPPPEATPGTCYYYECLECKGDGDPSGFDELTGIHINHALQQWVLCWYLIGFCSVSQVAQVLGLSIAEVMQMAQQGAQLAELPSEDLSDTLTSTGQKKKEARKQKQADVEEDDLRTRSRSRGKYKPGPKSSA